MSQISHPLRVGLIGYGYAGKTFHAPLISSVSGVELTAIGSSKPETVQRDYPSVLVCSPDEVPTHPGIDLVVIATPNESHFPLAAAALQAGKHVVVDKPFTITLAEARSLAELARKHDRLLSVFHNRRWESEVLATKLILESRRLGRVTHYECHMDRFRPVVRRRWREDPGPGAGLWFDLGPHLIDLALYLFGLPESVNANFGVLRESGQTDDWAHVQLNFPRLRVILNATLLSAGRTPRSILHGTCGTWIKFGADVQEHQLITGMSPADPRFGIDPNPSIFYDGAAGAHTEIPSPAGNQCGYYIGIRDAIVNQSPNPVPPRDAVAVMAILETSFASEAQGKTLPLPLTPDELAAWQ